MMQYNALQSVYCRTDYRVQVVRVFGDSTEPKNGIGRVPHAASSILCVSRPQLERGGVRHMEASRTGHCPGMVRNDHRKP